MDQDDVETARNKLAEIENQIPGLSAEDTNLWRHKVDLWNAMVDLAASKPPSAHLPALQAALKKAPDEQWVPLTISAEQVPVLCKELKLIAISHDRAVPRPIPWNC